MAKNLLDGVGDEESPANEFNLLATAKKRAVKKFLGGGDFPSPFLAIVFAFSAPPEHFVTATAWVLWSRSSLRSCLP